MKEYMVKWISPFSGDRQAVKASSLKDAKVVADRIAHTGANAAVVTLEGGKVVSMRMTWAR